MRFDENKVQDYEKRHLQYLTEITAECTVLLRKDGQFPLSSPQDIALYGSGIRHTIRGGSGSGEVNVRQFENIEDSLTNAGFKITTTSWLDKYDDILKESKENFYQKLKIEADAAGLPVIYSAMGKTAPQPDFDIPIERNGNTAIYVLSRTSGEGADRSIEAGDFKLTSSEIRDILKLNKIYNKFMLVLNVGGAVDLTPVKNVKNILLLGQLGSVTSQILTDILIGKSFPSGKLTTTWTTIENYPSTKNFGMLNDTVYEEGLYVGYRYFDLAKKDVLYPFGFGLSNTNFELKANSLLCQSDVLTAEIEVKNTGNYRGKEVVQLYVSPPGESVERPLKELVGTFKTSELGPGEKEVASISFSMKDLGYYNEESASTILEGGIYVIQVGTNSKDTIPYWSVKLDSEIVLRKLKNICSPEIKMPKFEEADFLQKERKTLYNSLIKTLKNNNNQPLILNLSPDKKVTVDYTSVKDLEENYIEDTISWDSVVRGKNSLFDFARSLSNEQLALLSCGSGTDNNDMGNIIGSASEKVAGAAGETSKKLENSHHLPSIVMADGPAGVRINPIYTLENNKAKPLALSFGESMIDFLHEEDIQMMKDSMGISKNADSNDVFYQYCTSIPVGTSVAQSFNPEVAQQYGDIVAEEMKLFGVSIWLAPALNIHRSPLCGRNFEYYSEDPYVSGVTASNITKGVQNHPGRSVTIKHFAANNQETNRYRNNSVLSERVLREIYLKGFEICLKESRPASVMTSYNLINGEHACNSHDLLTNVLRDEWGFEGFVMTDWFITSNQIGHIDGAKYPEASAAGCILAGNNLIMPGMITDLIDIKDALKNTDHPYHITRKNLVSNVLPILKEILVSTIV